MDINELESFKLSDAVAFHKELNPKLWDNEKLDPEVRGQLLLIAEDFVEYLGISNLKVRDVTISGSNAAYSYTPHSDLDLHVLVDFNELPNNEVYQELFTAKKTLYNDAHDITVRNVPVELYVQDTNNPVQSLGEYSIVQDKWIRIPKKRRANFDEVATKAKYEKLGDLIELALKTKDAKRVNDTIALVKRYRKSGLDKAGEFGPENLAYKAVRKQGLVQALHDLKAQLHTEKLSIEESDDKKAAVLKIQKHLNKKYGANLDLDGKLGPLTLKSINKFMPKAKTGLADEPNKTTAVQGKKLKEAKIAEAESDVSKASVVQFKTLPGPGKPRHSFRVVYDGKVIAYGEVEKDSVHDDEHGASVQEIVVHNKYRRMGIASKIYSAIERKFGYELHPSDDVRPDGQEFWRARSNIDEAPDYSQYENEIENFVQSLNPDDVGVEEIGPYHVHFEGFTDECQQDAERRCNLPSDNPQHLANYDDVYKEVIRDFVRREGGKKPLKVGFAGYQDYPVIYAVFDNPEPYKNPDAWNPKIDEASGYIPSAKEKNDPRFKTALTKDVTPSSNKDNAKAFGWKVSRAGIPPQARADGKIAEDLMREFKTFLGEQQEEMFPGYDEQHREKRLGNWLAKSWGVQNGKPQTFYHATTKDFDTFNTHGTGFASALGMAYEVERHGSFFAVDPMFAETFIEDPNTGRVKEGGRVLSVHLSIQSPIDLRDDALSRMLSDEETVEEFKANDIDLRSIYNHFYELERWELFDGPEGAEFIDNLQKLGFDGAIINEAIPNDSNAKSGQVWVAFNPSQVKSVYNRGSFSPDDPRLTKESG
jgi:hypothetical protein